ncbi:MAG: hypothetical protein JWO36_5634 [Myxococcales bacterium]|nr:hypothetical protein [Myxococcales bacterium]
MRGVRAFVFSLAMLGGCAPQVDGPVEQHRAVDRDDADRLARQLAELPGAVRSQVTLHRPVRDPLGTEPPGPASAAVLVVVDDQADRAAIERSARALARGTAPEIADPSIVIEIGAIRPVLAQVGPFTVEQHSKSALVAALSIALAVIAVLAGWVAWRERRRA